MNNKNDSKDYLNLLPIIFIALITIFSTIIYGFAFASNDDGMLRAIASGAYTGSPDAHLIYIMYPLGLLMKAFYLILPAISWYDIFMTAMHLSCWYMLLNRSLKRCRNYARGLIAFGFMALFLLAVDFKYLILHQYTVLAALLLATATFYIATAREADYKKDSTLVIILLTLSLWVRKEVFLMGFPIVALIVLVRFIRRGFKKKASVFIPFGIMAVIFLTSYSADYLAYSSEEWKSYKSFNSVRTEVYDYAKFPEYEEYKDSYTKQGIDSSEYEVLVHMMDISLPDDVTEENLAALAEKHDEIIKEWQQFYSVPRKVIKDTGIAILRNEVQPIGILMFVSCLLVFFIYLKKNIWYSLAAVATYGYRVAFTALFVYLGRFPERVSYSLYLMITVLMFGLIVEAVGNTAEFKNKKPVWAVKYVLLVFLSFLGIMGMIKTYQNKKYVSTRTLWLEAIYDYCGKHVENTYFVNTYSVAPLTESMFSFAKLPDNCIVMGNWTSHSPLEAKRLSNAEITSFQEGLVNDEEVYLIECMEFGTDWIENFYMNKGISAKAVQEGQIKASNEQIFYVYKIEKTEE